MRWLEGGSCTGVGAPQAGSCSVDWPRRSGMAPRFSPVSWCSVRPGPGPLAKIARHFERWVLLVGTEVDHEAKELNTTHAMAPISDAVLVHRVTSESKGALPGDVVKLVGPQHGRELRRNRVG